VRDGLGFRLAYTLQDAVATATDPFLLNRLFLIDPITGDTTRFTRAEFPLDYDRRHTVTAIGRARVPEGAGPRVLGVRPLGGLEAAAIVRVASGLPYTVTDLSDDTEAVLPNSGRLPWASSVDLLLRRPIRLGGARGGVYLDMRNLLDRRNIVAVRRDTGRPEAPESAVTLMAEAAYAAHPEAIPFESARYRAGADLNHDGYVAGREELFPLYLAAARDYTQPVFAYGPPRLARLGVELLF
jgi:hypothetical protein